MRASPYTRLTPALLDELRRELGAEAVLAAADFPEAMAEHGRDATQETMLPEAVVQARDAAQVAALLRLANARGFAVTPRGAGTGLAGGSLPAFGGVVLSLSGMDRILEIHPGDMVAVVEPGVITSRLREEAARVGLFYPPDPASLVESTLGGNAATNAGGPACVKYGVTRQYVLGLQAVLPTGEIVEAGTRTRKGVVGYDLAGLMVGSEGTLGVITRLTLKLVPLPRAVRCAVAVFADLRAALAAVSGVMAGGVTPSAAEFMDARCLALVGDLAAEMGATDLPRGAAMLLLETDGDQAGADRDMAAVERICRDLGALHWLPAQDQGAEDAAGRERLWDVRRQVSLRIHDAWAVYVPEDVAVPLSRIADLAEALPGVEERHGLTVYAFGHAGDGNIHLNVTAASTSMAPAVERGVRELLGLVLDLGGTISGEHGVGLAKRRFVPLEQSEPLLEAQRAVKRALDPNMILNPGKLF